MEEKETSPKYYLSDVYLESLRKHKQRHKAKEMVLDMKSEI